MERTGLRMYPSIRHCAFCSRACNSSVDQRKTLRMSVAPASRVYRITCYLNDMHVGRHSGASPRSAMFRTPVDTWGATLNIFLFRVLPQSQAEAHYKGNRHARRVKGIETSKSRPQEGDKPHAVPPTSSPSPSGAAGTPPDSEPSKSGERSAKER